MVIQITDCFCKTVVTTVITCQYTVQTVVTNRNLRCRPYLDNDHCNTRNGMLLQGQSDTGVSPLAAAVQAAQGNPSDPTAQALAQEVSCCVFQF